VRNLCKAIRNELMRGNRKKNEGKRYLDIHSPEKTMKDMVTD
jgi:hypothetical protein